MKVTFIQPPWAEVYGGYRSAAKVGNAYPPLGLCYLTSQALSAGCQVEVIDAEAQGLAFGQAVERVSNFKPDLIAVTSTTPIFHITKNLVKELKTKLSSAFILGGPHITVLPLVAMRQADEFDFGVYGEGELTFREFLDVFQKGKNYSEVKGLLYRNSGKVVKNEPRPFVEDLDQIPNPARSLLDSDKYHWSVPGKGDVRMTTIMASRGCPFQCIFCSQHTMFGRKVRFRSPSKVVDEIEDVVSNSGIRHFAFIDDTLTLDRGRIEKFCAQIIERRVSITWEGWTRANTVDEKLFRLMRGAGLRRISFGIESAEPKILAAIKKEVNSEDLTKAYRAAKKAGIETRGSVILGLPYETSETALNTLHYVRDIKDCDQLYLNIATPYPGTELYDMAVKGEGGIKLLTNDFSKFQRYDNPVIEVNDLKAEDLSKLQRRGFKMFYFIPRRIWYNFMRAGIWAGIKNAAAFVKSVIFSRESRRSGKEDV